MDPVREPCTDPGPQDLADCLGLLGEIDRQVTPAFVTARYRELLADFGHGSMSDAPDSAGQGRDKREDTRPVQTLRRLPDTGLATQPQREMSVAGTAALRVVAADELWEAPHSAGTTVRRLVLGGHLRRLREQTSITTEQAAAAMRSSPSMISRMERGRVAFKERDIDDLLNLYGVADREDRRALLDLAREANTPGWWHGYADILPNWVEPYIGLEAAATLIRTYELQFIHGLLQTESYARALIRLGNATTEDAIIRRAEVRLSRQGILSRDTPPRLWVIMDESALHRPIGGKAVVREQIRHLIEMCHHPAVTLQILPFRMGGHPAMGGPFTILRFPAPDLRDVVYIEQLTSAVYLDQSADVYGYTEVMDRLSLQAEPAARTPELLRDLLAEI